MASIDTVMSTLHLPPKTGRLAKRLKIVHSQRKRPTYPLCYVLFAAKLTDANIRLVEAMRRINVKPEFEKDYAAFEMDISGIMQFKFAFDGTNSVLGDPFPLLKDTSLDLGLDFKESWTILEKLYIHEHYINYPMMGLVAIACYHVSSSLDVATKLGIPQDWLSQECSHYSRFL
eukprot:NODE_696_length_5082_cov_0.330724.p3 type:complete len:174 gc:universal NODE_696_length_5082_cov_0.330724:228-749(+)